MARGGYGEGLSGEVGHFLAVFEGADVAVRAVGWVTVKSLSFPRKSFRFVGRKIMSNE